MTHSDSYSLSCQKVFQLASISGTAINTLLPHFSHQFFSRFEIISGVRGGFDDGGEGSQRFLSLAHLHVDYAEAVGIEGVVGELDETG